MGAPEPEEILAQTREEGRRRLSRPPLELAATALVGGFDVALGIAAYCLTYASVAQRSGEGVAHLLGAIAFGIGFVFIVVGRSELFTENFLVPVASLERRIGSWLKLGELWIVSLVLNIAGGALLVVILTSTRVLRPGSGEAAQSLGGHIASYDVGTAFLSALIAGGLMTLMTWLVEGAADSLGVRIVLGWIVGFALVLGTFNHAIVSQIEELYAIRYGAGIGWGDWLDNLGIAAAGNLVGGVLFVTLTRFGQAVGSRRGSG